MRAIFYESQKSLTSGVYVLVAKEHMGQMSYEALKKCFVWSVKRLGCLVK
jgi:RNase P protein component